MSLTDRTSRLALVSAWNDSGGAFLNRLLDGHPDIASWPFELQLGTPLRAAGSIHPKYRWPAFSEDQREMDAIFDQLVDDELKSVLRGNPSQKFAGYVLPVDISSWRDRFRRVDIGDPPERRKIIAGYIDAFLAEWQGERATRQWIIGHCPNIVLDTEEIFADFPDAKIIHVVRDPVAGLASLRRRHPGYDAQKFASQWNAVNGAAVDAIAKQPRSILVLRYEGLLEDREAVMHRVASHLGLKFDPALLTATWNGQVIDESDMGPFGGVHAVGHATEDALRGSIDARETAFLYDATQALRLPT
jgi:hypothetical protein